MSNAQQLALPGVAPESANEWVWDEGPEGENDVSFAHATVMLSEVVSALAPEDGATYVDATLGGGGHTEAILEAAPGARVIAFDRDETAIEAARARLARERRALGRQRRLRRALGQEDLGHAVRDR